MLYVTKNYLTLATYGVNLTEAAVLELLPKTVRKITEKLSVTRQRVDQILTKLHMLGLIDGKNQITSLGEELLVLLRATKRPKSGPGVKLAGNEKTEKTFTLSTSCN